MSAPTDTGHGDTRAPATVCIHAGLPEARQGEPFLPGPTFAAPYHLMGDVAASPYAYNRQGNPTWTAYESALGELEHGHVTVFASGLAAIVAVVVPTLSPGDRLLVPSDSYSLVRDLAKRHLEPRGVVVEMAPTGTAAFREAIPRADLVWLESLSNPRLDACDVADLIEVAHAHGAQVAVDNSFVTPLGQRPLDLGADFAVASASKYLTGHSDLMLGYVAVTSEQSAQEVRRWRSLTGAVAGPFEAWLAHRSLATLALRFERQCANALALAGHLSAQPGVQDVRYPGLPGDSAHEVASRQMEMFGSVITFSLASAERAEAFLGSCALVLEATSFGGIHTTAERTRRWGHDDVPEGFIRMSVGCEASEDIIADVTNALAPL